MITEVTYSATLLVSDVVLPLSETKMKRVVYSQCDIYHIMRQIFYSFVFYNFHAKLIDYANICKHPVYRNIITRGYKKYNCMLMCMYKIIFYKFTLYINFVSSYIFFLILNISAPHI